MTQSTCKNELCKGIFFYDEQKMEQPNHCPKCQSDFNAGMTINKKTYSGPIPMGVQEIKLDINYSSNNKKFGF